MRSSRRARAELRAGDSFVLGTDAYDTLQLGLVPLVDELSPVG